MAKLIRSWGLLFLSVWLIAASGVAAQTPAAEPVEVRVMTFNIWVGGELVDLGQVVEAIRAADADVVLLQEAGGNSRLIAELLGWPHASERMQVISRLPLIDPEGADGNYILVQTGPGQVFAVTNVHLPSDPYGPYLIRDGLALDEVLQNEADTRVPGIEAHLAALTGLLAEGMPVVLGGDFNSPSHQDWTAAAIAGRPEARYPVQWPVTQAVEAAGLVDTYRVVHPDPVSQPGITWTYGYPYPRLRAGEVLDRIDFLFASSAIEIVNSHIVGPGGSANADIPITPYPSDHRAVAATLRLTPVEPPLFTSLDRRVVQAGDPIVVRYHVPVGEASDRIFILPADAALTEETPLMSLPPMEADFFGAVTFGSATLAPGAYDAVGSSGDLAEYARARFWVVAPGSLPVVRTDQADYASGEPVEVSWDSFSGNRWDWIAVYAAGDADLTNYLAYVYTGSASSGRTTLDADVLGELAPGDYVVRLMQDDWYSVMAEAPFRVRE
ncbi:MAG TPA: endonuclease/exonuclease/phosphatase family protein [Candidatus Limnocylindrales bacterium]|nr:endonuclease/exonuclease/phosphatase family protein [Candidatus Limnocylindrales bacterium]